MGAGRRFSPVLFFFDLFCYDHERMAFAFHDLVFGRRMLWTGGLFGCHTKRCHLEVGACETYPIN